MKFWREKSEMALIHLHPYIFYLFLNCQNRDLESELLFSCTLKWSTHRKQFLGKSNRQKLFEIMHWTPSCCKFFQMLTRCSHPYITEWIKIQFCILRYQITCRYLLYHAELQHPPGNSTKEWVWILLASSPHHILTLLSFITLSFFKNNLVKTRKNFPNVHFHFFLYPLSPRT